jgi:PAS domain S-box-containing protein
LKLLNLSQDHLIQGGIEVKSDYNGEIFNKSPIGILIYDKEGKLVDVNLSALKIVGIPKEDASDINLFENTFLAQKKDALTKNGLLRFQVPLHLEINKNSCKPLKPKTDLIDWIVSVIDSGFLVQIQNIIDKPSQSEEKYRSFFEDDITGDFIATPGGRVLECNPAFAEIYGFDDCEKACSSDFSQFNPADWTSIILRLKVECNLHGYQSWHERPDGRRIHVVSNVVGIFSDVGELVQVKGYVFDDTDRKRAEEALMESEEKYHRLFDEDLTGDFIATPGGEVLECNPAFAEIYGFDDCEKAVHWNISEFNPSDWSNLIKRLKTEHKVQNHQSTHEKLDGRRIHVVSNVVGIFSDVGELVQVKGYVFDDTERRNAEEALMESEEKYHRLFDEDLTGDFIATPGGEVLECNPAFAEIYGFDDCEKAVHWNISEFNPFDWPYMVTRLKSEVKIKGYQSWQRRSDGLRIHIVANVVGIFSDTGKLVQVKGYVFDDTERKKTEEELNRSKQQVMNILNSFEDGFIALNYYWKFIYVNQSAAQYFGFEPDDLIGQNLWEQFPELKGTTYETAFRRARDEQEIQYFEAPGIRKDQLFDVSVYPLDEGISVCLHDVNLHKKSEKRSNLKE